MSQFCHCKYCLDVLFSVSRLLGISECLLIYCNSLYAHCNVSTRQRLQRVQNRAARPVLNVPPRTPSLPLLQQLHWLPIEARISYKLCSLMYRVTHGTAPLYIVELCQPCSDTRLRSALRSDYNVPRTNRRFTNSSFSISAPTVWNCFLAISVTRLLSHLS